MNFSDGIIGGSLSLVEEIHCTIAKNRIEHTNNAAATC